MAYLPNVEVNPSLFGAPSVGNSSIVPLGDGATFTGTGGQNDYPEALVSLNIINNE